MGVAGREEASRDRDPVGAQLTAMARAEVSTTPQKVSLFLALILINQDWVKCSIVLLDLFVILWSAPCKVLDFKIRSVGQDSIPFGSNTYWKNVTTPSLFATW